MAKLKWFAEPAVIGQPEPHIIHVSGADDATRGSIIVLDLADEVEAVSIAQKLAQETGRRVTVRNSRFALIETIPAASVH